MVARSAGSAHHGVLAQMLGGLAGIGMHVPLEQHQLVAEERHSLVVHVLAVGHGQHFRVRQLFGGLGLPVVGQLGIFLAAATEVCRVVVMV